MEGLKIEGKEDEYLTDRLNFMALDFIEQAEENPFFLYLSHFSVHDPIQGRKDLVEKYRAKSAKLPPIVGPEFILEGNPDVKIRCRENNSRSYWASHASGAQSVAAAHDQDQAAAG